MATIQTVFAAPSTPMDELEAAIKKHSLAVGPFGQPDESQLRNFLTSRLRPLKSLGRESDHKLYLYLHPTRVGWLAETLADLNTEGLNNYCLDGLILSTADYHGEMCHLWSEASAFLGPKSLWYSKSSGKYCEPFLRGVKGDDWEEMYVSVEGSEESDRYNQTIALLRIARKDVGLRLPLLVSHFSTESLRCNTVLLGSQGFYVDTPEP